MSNVFRQRTVVISASTHEAMKAHAAVNGLSCPDESADLLLRERIDADPLLAWIGAEYGKAMTALRKATQERIEQSRRGA